MFSNIFDSHCHYDDEKFSENRKEVIENAFNNGVCAILHAATDLKSSEFGVKQSKEFERAYTSVGIHPECCNNLDENYLEILKELAKDKKVVAIGEIGLDYYWTKDTKDIQLVLFENQLKLANELNLPVIIHSREATFDCIELLKKYKPRGVVHCFSGSKETAKELIDMGLYISFTGVITFPNSKNAREALMVVPNDRLLLETDCPYMAPVPNRGKVCTSDMIAFTAEKIAELKGLETSNVLDMCCENSKRLFNITF